MGHIAEFKKISGTELLFCLFFVSGGACPGLLAIWNFAPRMIDNCTAPMLIVLSVAITLPIISINSIFAIYAVFQSHDEPIAEFAPVCIGVGSAACMITVGLPFLVAFLFSLSLKTSVWFGIGIELLFLGLCFAMGLLDYKQPKTTSPEVLKPTKL